MILDREGGRWQFIASTICMDVPGFPCKNMGTQKDPTLFAFILIRVILFALLLMLTHFPTLFSE